MRSRPFPTRGLTALCAGFGLAATLAVPAAATARGEDDGATLRRVLHLRGGQVIRVVSRERDGQWEYKNSAGWQILPQGAVELAVLEKDVLAQWKQRERALADEAAPAQRVALAEWMLASGLHQEAFLELDEVLEAAPQQGDALELLAQPELARYIGVPRLDADGEAAAEEREALYRWAANMPLAAREVAIAALERNADGDGLQAELARELRSNALRRRSFAAQALGRLYPTGEVKNLLMHAVLDPSEDVRASSARALAATGEPGVIVPMVRALNSQQPRVRLQAAQALGHTGYAAAVEPLMTHLSALSAAQSSVDRRVPHGNIFIGKQFAYIQDFDVEVAQFQAVADPQVNVLIEGDVLDAGVRAVNEYSFVYESKAVRGSLERLTGERPGHTARAWQRWWEQNQERWSAEALSRRE